VREIAVHVGRAFPRCRSRQVGGFSEANLPLVHRVVGNAIQPTWPLHQGCTPAHIDAVVERQLPADSTAACSRATMPAAARIDADADVACLTPFPDRHFPVWYLLVEPAVTSGWFCAMMSQAVL